MRPDELRLISLASGSANPRLVTSCDDKAPALALEIFMFQNVFDSSDKGKSTRMIKPEDKHARMTAGSILANVRKVQVLCNEETLFLDCLGPNSIVVLTNQTFICNRIDFVAVLVEYEAERRWNVFVKLYVHQIVGVPT